jgi:hypothetical protein
MCVSFVLMVVFDLSCFRRASTLCTDAVFPLVPPSLVPYKSANGTLL